MFDQLGLSQPILKALSEIGFKAPTPIQSLAIPEVIAGHDLLASAQTGTGKTAAFMLPVLDKLVRSFEQNPSAKPNKGPKVVVLTPTRELAMQITKAVEQYGKYPKPVKVVNIVGGMPYPKQIDQLKRPHDIIVATPGRLIDHINSKRIDMTKVETLVLDEADRMLDMGFIDDVKRIAKLTPENRQTSLFSATFDKKIIKLSETLLKNPKKIEIEKQGVCKDNIQQSIYFVDDRKHKNNLLKHLLIQDEVQQVIIFAATKMEVDNLADDLSDDGIDAVALHGDMRQNARTRTVTRLRNGQARVLVATDVASRGIDLNMVSHVVNYDLPKFAEDYIHRIGRTGRAGASGKALSFCSTQDRNYLRRIETYIGKKIQIEVVEGLEPKKGFNDRSFSGNSRNSGVGNRGRGGRSSGGYRSYNGENGGGESNRRFQRRGPNNRENHGNRSNNSHSRFSENQRNY